MEGCFLFLSADFPRNFVRNTIGYFSKDKDDFIISEWLFDEQKKTVPKRCSVKEVLLEISQNS